MPITDHTAFIIAHTRLLPVPLTPEISLYLADEATELWQKTEDELGQIGLPPPFWAFAWAGGQALARYILDNPALVRGKNVLDFASGSGLVAIAAKMAGAAAVLAADIDHFAYESMRLNMAANANAFSATLENQIGQDVGWDVVLAGDIAYERDTALAVSAWLESLHKRGAVVLIGDPGRSYLARDKLDQIITYSVPVTRALEDTEIKKSSVWRFKA